MQNDVIKAGKSEQYVVMSAAVFYQEDSKRYDGMLLLAHKGRKRSGHGASEIRVWSKNKETVYKQLRQIAELYPPEKDVHILDMEEILK